jgi:hypothetical protein
MSPPQGVENRKIISALVLTQKCPLFGRQWTGGKRKLFGTWKFEGFRSSHGTKFAEKASK